MNKFIGEWKSHSGSRLNITGIINNSINGFYITQIGDNTSNNIKCEITGWCTSEIINFSVLWEKKTSVTSWVVRYQTENGKESIHTMWILVSLYNELNEERAIWESFQINNSIFYKT